VLNKNQNIKKNKEIVFKIPEFPHLSETFIIAQIVTALNLGYKIKIVTRKVIENTSLISPLIFEYNLLDNIIIEDYKIPRNKVLRLFKWVFILIQNINHLKSIVSFHREFSKLSLSWLYQWRFYFQFNDASIIHIQYGTNAYPFRIIKNKTIFKPIVIVTFHGHDAFFPLYGRIPNDGYYKRLFDQNYLITANTPYLAQKLIELGCPDEILRVVPVGVDTDFFHPRNVKKEFNKTLKLITVGRLDKFKGQLYCIKAVNLLISNGIDVTLTIIGEGEERKNLQKLIVECQLQEKVFLLGKKSQIEVRRALWNHDVYLLTGVATTSGLRESQGLATLEAQACGLPVIAFDSGGIKYTIQDKKTGFICSEFDVQEVAQKIELFYSERNLIKEMGKNAVIFVNNNFSQKKIDKIWKIIYDKMIKNE